MDEVEQGTFRVIRVDGSETVVRERPTLDNIHSAIGCDTFDAVLLDQDREIVMLVDDTGMLDGKPVNPKATELYHARFQTGFSIYGDVAIVCDKDFE